MTGIKAVLRSMEACMLSFDGEAFVQRFMTVWDNHDVAGIMEMFTDDVVYEPSIGTKPWGERAVGKEAAGKLSVAFFEQMPDARYNGTDAKFTGTSSAPNPPLPATSLLTAAETPSFLT
jgi:hypothetical protein